MKPTGPSVVSRDPANTMAFSGLDNSFDGLCGTTGRFVLLRDLALSEMAELAESFASEHDNAMLEFFLRPSAEVRKPKIPVSRRWARASLSAPEALAVKTEAHKGGSAIVCGQHCSATALQKAVELHNLWDKYVQHSKNDAPAWQLLFEPYEVQRQVVETILVPNIRTMAWARPASDLDLFASARVIELMEGCSTALEYLQRVCDPLVDWFGDPILKNARGAQTYGARRPFVLAWFAMWLSERGVLIFPASVCARCLELIPIRYRHFYDAWICNPALRAERQDYYKRIVVGFTTEDGRCRAEFLLIALNLVSPGISQGRVDVDSLTGLKRKVALTTRDANIFSVVWRLEVTRLKHVGIDADLIQVATSRLMLQHLEQDNEGELWGWVDGQSLGFERNAKYQRRQFHAGENLKAHVQELRIVFPAIAGKSGATVVSRLAIWLFFLSSLGDELVPRKLVDITPRLLSTIESKNSDKTLLGFMVLHDVSIVVQRTVFGTLKAAWRVAASRNQDGQLLCPISDQLNSLEIRGLRNRAANSVRPAIDMEILELMIQENRANDFAFSRNRSTGSSGLLDFRLVVNPDTGNLERLWWPGTAVLIDTLLQIPMRHKQGRYLDSGEGDEFMLDIFSLQLRLNPLATATARRNQAFIQRVSMSALRDEPGLGMFINTNKTGRDYAFPWLMADIAENVQSVILWQQKYNPISKPVSDRKPSRIEKAANAEPIWVYPVFRDPSRHDCAPVSSGIVLEYFRSLLKHVEQKYNLANGSNVQFFRANGEAIYDIHALRVTGVTRLLSMGVDPRIVRLLVGHSSLTMVWYYDCLTNQRVADAMQKTLELRRPTREALFLMSTEERERFFGRLFGKKDSAGRAINWLRGLVEERSPFLLVRVDGFCPGKRCEDAGVYRPKACSLCPFNVTGAAFLAGLVLKLNDLMAEVILHQGKLAELRESLFATRKAGGSSRALGAEIDLQEKFVDHLLSEWEAQFQLVKEAELKLASWLNESEGGGQNEVPLLALMSPSPENMGLVMQESHHLCHFTNLIEGAKRVVGFSPTIGAREARDSMLLEIARHEAKADLFYRLDPIARKVALDQFALLLLEQQLPPERISELIDGHQPLSMLPTVADWLTNLDVTDSRRFLALEGADHE